MYTLHDLIKHVNGNHVEIGGKWVPVRPLLGPFIVRIKAAWAVLTGKADAFTWPEGQ